jgi:hypothetical protein
MKTTNNQGYAAIEAKVKASLQRRQREETRFRMFGIAAVLVALSLVASLFGTISAAFAAGIFQQLSLTMSGWQAFIIGTAQTAAVVFISFSRFLSTL